MDYKKAMQIIKKSKSEKLTGGEAWDLQYYIDSLVEAKAGECCVAGVLRDEIVTLRKKLDDK